MVAPTIITAEEAKQKNADDLFTELNSSPRGLATTETTKRLAQYGPNSLAEEKVNPLLKFLGYFWGPIPWMIEIAAILSAVVRHVADLIIILVLLVFNALVGFWQEHKAANALEALKKQLALKARVLRDGRWEDIAADQLVP
jgi:H+-transporting ATPase